MCDYKKLIVLVTTTTKSRPENVASVLAVAFCLLQPVRVESNPPDSDLGVSLPFQGFVAVLRSPGREGTRCIRLCPTPQILRLMDC